ncbi:RHS repeat-associated core domain-containing protein, partial [Teredinibacter turnerae]
QFDRSVDQYYLRARYYDQGVGRFTQMDTWMGRVRDPITLNKYLYAEADPAGKVDPSGKMSIGSQMSAINIQGTLSTIAVRGASKKALDIARRAKVFNVYSYAQMPVHFYMYVERKGSASGIRYDVGAPGGWGNLGQQLCRGNICGRIPGFVQSSRASRHSLRGVRARVASFSLGQYMLWHATVMGTEQMECSIDITYSLVPGPNCLSWTISATAKAVAISRLRL